MGEDVITTGVDALLELLRGVDKISMSEAHHQLHVPLETLQSWVDFLVEERIVGIEYTFTKPFIYLNRDQPKKKGPESPKIKLEAIKKDYLARAKAKKIPSQQVPELWKTHVQQELAYLEPFFAEQAQRRGVQDTRERKTLWEEYNRELLNRLEQL